MRKMPTNRSLARLGQSTAERPWPATTLRALLVAALSLCMAVGGFAQSSNSSDLRGTVTDSTGAVIPGATVAITNTETGVVTVLTTNESGIYDSVSIRPGKYKVTFIKEGFGKLVRDGITLNVGVVHGGTRSNVVAAEAQGEIDVETNPERKSS